MVGHYASHGETHDLREVGKMLADDLYPRLWEMGIAMSHAREQTREKWRREEQEKEAADIQAAEKALMSNEKGKVLLDDAKDLIDHSEGQVYAYYHQSGNWHDKQLNINQVLDAIQDSGARLTNICPESAYMLAVNLDNRLYYVPTDYDARENYLASLKD